MPSADTSNETRFGKRVTVLPNGCWAYNGNLDKYGRFVPQPIIDGNKSGMPAHRFAWETFRGPIAPAMHLHHVCENKGCVNPAHLDVLTPAQHQQVHARMRSAQAS